MPKAVEATKEVVAALHALPKPNVLWVIQIATGKPILIRAYRFNPVYHELVEGQEAFASSEPAVLAQNPPEGVEAVKPRKVVEPREPGAPAPAGGGSSEADVKVAEANAETAKAEAAKAEAEAEKAKAEAEKAKTEADANADAEAKAKEEAEKEAEAEAAKAEAEAEKAKADDKKGGKK